MDGDLLCSQEGLCSVELVSTKVQDRNLKSGPNSPRELVFMQTKKNVTCDLCFNSHVSERCRLHTLSRDVHEISWTWRLTVNPVRILRGGVKWK